MTAKRHVFAQIAEPILRRAGTLEEIGKAFGGISKQRVSVLLQEDPHLQAIFKESLQARQARRDQNWTNPLWPGQATFRDDVAAFRKKHRLTAGAMAAALELTQDGLKQVLSSRTRPPLHLSTFQRAARLFGKSVLAYIDDPALDGLTPVNRLAAIAAMVAVASALRQEPTTQPEASERKKPLKGA